MWFYACLVISVIMFMFFFYKFRTRDYLVGVVVGASCFALLVLSLWT